MNLCKAVKKAGPSGLVANASMRIGEGVTASGHPAIFLKDVQKWKVFWELKAKVSWAEATGDDWTVLQYKLTEHDLGGNI